MVMCSSGVCFCIFLALGNKGGFWFVSFVLWNFFCVSDLPKIGLLFGGLFVISCVFLKFLKRISSWLMVSPTLYLHPIR